MRLVAIASLALCATVLVACQKGAAPASKATSSVRKPVAVTVEAARTEQMSRRLELSGTVIPKAQVTIIPKSSGRVLDLGAEEGARVRKGQVLARLDVPEMAWQLQQGRSALAAAEANLELARDNLRRVKELREQDVASDQQLRSAEGSVRLNDSQVRQARASIRLLETTQANAVVTSPIEGIVLQRQVEVGAMAGPSTPLFTLARADGFQAKLAFSERDLALVREGAPVTVTSVALPGEVFRGRILDIAQVVDPQSRLISAKVALERTGRLRVGMNVVGVLAAGTHQGLVVPTSAVQTDGAEQVVYVADGSRAVRTPVRTGLREAARVEVLSGLARGARVVADGAAFVKDGDSLTIKAGG
ncbi:MAG: efflux RND transporter periplasmic adaptor subunit [Candidatus Sericytochromatia bacterium]|nr:efflux RND transporter periplasmic adaptor subunit [Candidatus Sericytochromatia bacterium]